MSLPHNHNKQSINLKLVESIINSQQFESVTIIFKLLSDLTRLKIFWILCHSEQCVINIAAIMHMSSPAVAHHLKCLKKEHLIISKKAGKEVYYRAMDNEITQLIHQTIEQIMKINCIDL